MIKIKTIMLKIYKCNLYKNYRLLDSKMIINSVINIY